MRFTNGSGAERISAGSTRSLRPARVEELPTRELDLAELEIDWSADDATLIYDMPAREAEDAPFQVVSTTIRPPPRTRATAQRVSGARILVTVVGALVGAMAAAWSIEGRALGAPPPSADDLIITLGQLWRVDDGARMRVAAMMPQASAPRRSAPMLPEPQPSTNPAAPSEPPSTPAASAAPVEVEQARDPEPEPEAEPKPEPDREPERTARTASDDRPMRRAATHSDSAPSARRTGVLRINSRPWSKVFVDGRPIGSTPQTAIELSPGRHRIVLRSEEFALERTLTVKVRAGQTVTRSVELLQ